MGSPRWATSISTVRSSSAPSRSRARNFSRVSWTAPASGVAPKAGRAGGRSRSSRRSSASSRARCSTARVFSPRTILMASSTKSRIIDSTSRPTYPTSVYLEASTLMNGASASRASRRAISVLPTPVGPIMMMFFGATSSRRPAGSRCRRQRFRSAMATARLASCCPMMYLSNSATIWRGVI